MTAVSGFTGCCGADIFYGFASDPQAKAGYKVVRNPTTGINEYEKDKSGNPIRETYEDLFWRNLEKQKNMYKGGRMMCLILNEFQYNSCGKAWAAIIKKAGFEFVRRWTNGGHSDEQYLYLFVLCIDQKGRCEGDFTVPPEDWDDIEVEQPKTLFEKAKEVLVPPVVNRENRVPPPREAPGVLGANLLAPW